MTPAPSGSRRTRLSRSHSQRGQAAFIVVFLLAVGIGLFAYGAVSSVSLSQQQDLRTRQVLTMARDALIGWSVARTTTVPLPNARPGELPCPDMDNDGLEDGSCVAGAIGRVPWKTLGIPEPKDGAGETLWYAIAGPFRIWNMNGTRIDSDTKGDLTVYHDSTATVLTAEAVAVIFAPGPVVAGQNRDAANANNPANYLDTTGGVNNAIAGGPFISTQGSATFNDRLLAITTADLMPVVEMRVAREMLALLSQYKANSVCGCYPWAANNFDDDSVDGRRRGGVPIEVALPEAWGSGTIPSVPSWIIGTNEWGKRYYYAVALSVVDPPTSSSWLTVDGTNMAVVLITPGPAGASRPSANLPDYVDDAENSNNDDVFQTPSSTAYARDRLYIIP